MDDAIRQKMLELVYGLLEQDEAEELRRRIDADPQWAAAHAEACRMSQWLAEATRLRVQPLAFGLVEPAAPSALPTEPTEPAAHLGRPILACEDIESAEAFEPDGQRGAPSSPVSAVPGDQSGAGESHASQPAAVESAEVSFPAEPQTSTEPRIPTETRTPAKPPIPAEPPGISAPVAGSPVAASAFGAAAPAGPSRAGGQPTRPSLSFTAPAPRGKPVAARRKPWTRGANWTVGTAAAVLLLLSLGIYTYHRRQLGVIAEEHLRVVAALPAVVTSGAPAQVSVSTSTVTGRPLPAQLELAIHAPDGKRLWVHKEKTTPEGRLAVALPADIALSAGARLEVLAARRDRFERLEAPLEVRPAPRLTHVRTDRTVYRPGETVHFRSVTLTPFGLSSAKSLPLRFDVLDPAARRIGGAVAEGGTESGVGNGSWTIPGDAAAGDYAVCVRASASGPTDGSSDELGARPCRFHVLGEDSPPPARSLESAGAMTGSADSSLRPTAAAAVTGSGSPARDDPRLGEPGAATQSSGARLGDVVAAEAPASGAAPAAAAPAARDEWIVRFHPEGGLLAAGLENRVYFTARTGDGKPAALRGFVVDSEGIEWAVVETVHAGRGVFRWTPQAGQRYFLRVVEPAGIDHRYELPPARSDAAVALTTGTGVFAANDPLEFNLRAAKAGIPLVVAAHCRGVLVGQQALVTRLDQNGNNPVVIPLDASVVGAVRLTVFDYGGRQPEPIAERLVYRRPARRLSIEITTDADRHEPGAAVEVALNVRGPDGRKAPAVLGVAVVEDGPRLGVEPPAIPLECAVWFADALGGDEPAGRAEVLESDDPKADAAIDLLLGTINPSKRSDDPCGEPESGASPEGDSTYRIAQATAALPLVLDNLRDIRAEYEESLARYQSNRTALFQAVTTVIFFGGLALLLLVTMLAVLRMASGSQLWVSAVGAAVCCLVVGTILMTPQRPGVGRQGAIAFCPSDAAPAARPAPAADNGSDRAAQPVADQQRKSPTPAVEAEAPAETGAGSEQSEQRRLRTAAGPSPGTEQRNANGAEAERQAGSAEKGAAAAAERQMRNQIAERAMGAAPAAASPAEPTFSGRSIPGSAGAAPPPMGVAPGAGAAARGYGGAAPRDVDGLDGAARAAGAVPRREGADAAGREAGASKRSPGDGPPATLLWHPLLATDAEGRATFQVRLPRRAGMFRILVDAHADGAIGSAVAVLRAAPATGPSQAGSSAPASAPVSSSSPSGASSPSSAP